MKSKTLFISGVLSATFGFCICGILLFCSGILSIHHEKFHSGPIASEVQKEKTAVPAGHGIAPEDGDSWKNRKSNTIESFLPEDFYRKIAYGETKQVFYPLFSDRRAWDEIARSGFKRDLKNKLIAKADVILKQPLEALSVYNGFRFILEGNRARYEQAYFSRRNNLGTLVMAMCLTGNKEKYLPAVIDHLGAIMAEPYWCGPAHAPRDKDPMPCAKTAECIDLFAAETAMTTALTLQLLHREISAVSPRFYQFCRKTVLRKTVLPVMEHFEHGDNGCWWTHGTNNWTPWCASNILCAGTILLDDPLQLVDLTRKLNLSVSGFYDAYDTDGYCNEGPGYWYKAGVQMFCYCRTLNTMIPGCAEKLFRESKFRSMGEFGALMVICGRDHVVSADCGHVMNDGIHAGVIYDFGKWIDSDQLRSFALNRMQPDPRRRQVDPAEASICRFGTGEELISLLDTFFKMPSSPEKIVRKKLPPVSFWPGRAGIIRNADGFSAALKGGSNGEHHNHNDLGHFTLYYGECPLIIDLGTGMYSRRNFSTERYQLYYTSAVGHNALCFGKHIQIYGKKYTAGLTMPDQKTLVADLSKAYPEASGVKKYFRTLHCEKMKTVISDSVELKKKTAGVSTLYSTVAVKKNADGILDFGDGIFCTLKGANCTSIEPVALEDIPRHWGSTLWRIVIQTDNAKSEFVFQKK